MENNNKPNEKKTAIALSYHPEEAAPKVIATGKGYLADKIIAQAKDHQIPLHQDAKLAETLSKLELGSYIPQELYDIVAEVFVFVDQMDRIKNKVVMQDE
ncbi:MAG: hypothetical protein K0S47_1722 [Herbinix sp.]|jgi:flagellar biosynthesis protein|nr:hypothetical protein [Herbinix sp.]